MSWREVLGVAAPATQNTQNTQKCHDAGNSACFAYSALRDSKSAEANATAPAPAHKPEAPLPITCQAFKERGIDLLTEDRDFLRRYLPKATKRRRAIVCEYQRRWLEAMAKETKAHRRQNRGRLCANSWLRIESSTWPSP